MAGIPTMKLYKGDKILTCNVSDKDRFIKDGWKPEATKEPAKAPAKKG